MSVNWEEPPATACWRWASLAALKKESRSVDAQKKLGRWKRELGGENGRGEEKNILVVKVSRLDMPLLVVVRPLQDGPAPLSEQPLGGALDGRLGPLAAGVEEDDLADAAADEDLLLDGQAGQGVEKVALDAEGGHAAVVEGLEEVLDGLEEVGLRVEDGVLGGVAPQEAGDLGEEAELVHGRLAVLAGGVVGDAGALHAHFEGGDLLVDLVF